MEKVRRKKKKIILNNLFIKKYSLYYELLQGSVHFVVNMLKM